jgi:hypothetical protein
MIIFGSNTKGALASMLLRRAGPWWKTPIANGGKCHAYMEGLLKSPQRPQRA